MQADPSYATGSYVTVIRLWLSFLICNVASLLAAAYRVDVRIKWDYNIQEWAQTQAYSK